MERWGNFKYTFWCSLIECITIKNHALSGAPAWLVGIIHSLGFCCWTDFWWYWYLFQMPQDLTFTSENPLINYINVIACRMRNHPEGVYWYNPTGFEPDMHCKGCFDDLG